VERIVEAAARISGQEGQAGNLLTASGNVADSLSAKARAGIAVFLKAIEEGKAAITPDAAAIKKKQPRKGEGLRAGIGLSDCVVRLAVDSGIAEHHLNSDELSGSQRLGNLQELANAASLYEASESGLLEFLEHIELDRSLDESSGDDSSRSVTDAVTLITFHNTKGLEFRRVIMTGVEQGVFPRDDKSGKDLEEERRLFYVGATRAMDELYLTSCACRRMYGRTVEMKPSLFLGEMDHKGVRIIGSAPYGFRKQPKSSSAVPELRRSSDGRWAVGDRVFHDDHGYGSVVKIKETEDGPVVKVIFETLHEKSFLSLYQSSGFTRIKED